MKKGNSTTSIFNDSLQSLMNMRQLAQKGSTSLSTDNFGKSCNDDDLYVKSDYEYIPPSPSINIERMNNNQKYLRKNQQNNHRFAFLMEDIELDKNDNSTDLTFRMKYQLPNIQILKTPTKIYKPIQVVSFMKK